MSCEPLATLHTNKLEPFGSSKFVATVHEFELCASTTRVMPARGYSPNDPQVHTIGAWVALETMMTVTSVSNNSFVSRPIKYGNIAVKIECRLFLHRWTHIMISWLYV